LGYLDDVTLGGPVETVSADVAEIIRIGADIGLSLNASKCQIIGHSDLPINDSLLQSFTRVPSDNMTLLRAPLFPRSALDKAWDKCCEDLATA